MNRLIVLLILLSCGQSNIFAQITKFEKLCNDMLLNAWTNTSNDFTKTFIQKYIPMLAAPRGGWKIQEGMHSPPPQQQLTMHSFVFYYHPCINKKFQEGKLEFLTMESEGTVIGIRDIRLWLYFETKNDAVIAFNELVIRFDSVSKIKTMNELNERKVAQFRNPDADGFPHKVQIVLTKDSLEEKKYNIFFGYMY